MRRGAAQKHRWDRRAFLRSTALTGAVAGVPFARGIAAQPQQPSRVRRYASLGRTGLEISDVSFGASRLRRGQGDLVRHAIDRGVNYFDTADSYTGGQSEAVIGEALHGIRDRHYIATKTMAGAGDSAAEIMRALDGSLKRLKTDYVDVYFNHAVNDVRRLRNSGWFEFAERAKAQGKIRYTGISGHGGKLNECVRYALENDLVDVLLVAYNFGQDPAFYEGLTRSWDLVATQPDLPVTLTEAREKGVGVIAMKTLVGARLNDMRPYERDGSTFAQAAFRWTLGNPDVDGLIISMTSAERIDEFLVASGARGVGSEELALLRRYAQLNSLTYCRQACSACESACPYEVPIPDVLRTRMYATDYQDLDFARREYAALDTNASACLSCSGEPCARACAYGLDISSLCAPTHRMLA